MQFFTNLDNDKINIVNNYGLTVSRLYFIPSYLIWEFSSEVSPDKPIVLSQEENDVFYNNIKWLMTQSYSFPHKYSIKLDDKLIWLSEHCFDMEDEFQRDITPRLIIEKSKHCFVIYFNKPFIEQNNLTNNGAAISFAPAGNGYLTKNLMTQNTLQDDLINVFYHTLNNKKIVNNKVLKREKIIITNNLFYPILFLAKYLTPRNFDKINKITWGIFYIIKSAIFQTESIFKVRIIRTDMSTVPREKYNNYNFLDK